MIRCPQCTFLVPQLATDVCAVCAAQAPAQHVPHEQRTPWRMQHTLHALFVPRPGPPRRPIQAPVARGTEPRHPQPCEVAGCAGTAFLTAKGLKQVRTGGRPVRCQDCQTRHRHVTMHDYKARLRLQRGGG